MVEINEQEQQELFYKFSMFEKQIRELQQQIEAIGNGIGELNSLNFGLDELVGNTGKEIYAPLGKGIFVKAKLISEELNVDIGGGNLVKKSIPDTKALIEEQMGKLMQVKKELENNLEEMGREINDIIGKTQLHNHCHCKEGEECDCSHEDKECDCGDECRCEKKE
jgi:prefoldin alpha subunit